MHSSDQKSILKIDEELKNVLVKTSNTIKSWQMISTDPSKQKKISNNYMRKGSIAEAIRKHKSNCNGIVSRSSWTCFYQTNFKIVGEVTKRETRASRLGI